MAHGLRTSLTLGAAAVLTALSLVFAPDASAAPAISVTPSTGLHDGQTVTVHGTGYSPNVHNINVIQCPVSGASQNSCNVAGAKLFQSTDASGSFTVQLTVRAVINGVDCTKQACMIDGHEGTSETSGNDSSVDISFGSSSSGGSGSGSGSGSSGSGSGSNSGTGTGTGSGTGGGPTGANTGHQDLGSPRVVTTLELTGLGVVLAGAGVLLHRRRTHAKQ